MFIQYYVNTSYYNYPLNYVYCIFSHGSKLFAQIEIMKSSGLNEKILLLNKWINLSRLFIHSNDCNTCHSINRLILNKTNILFPFFLI